MPKFLIVDDHDILRQGVRKVIFDAFKDAWINEANNCAEALAKINNEPWDVVILDINIPGRSGLDLIQDIQTIKTPPPILVLSMYEERQMALRTIKAGAKGYLNKARAANNLIPAITKIMEGKQYISEIVAELLVNEYRREIHNDLLNELSDREYFIMLRLASGESASEISRKLNLSIKTISTYRNRLMKKLNLKNLIELYNFVQVNRIGEYQ
ncbi:MAG: DNA-binding response regulator [Bacteroidetes bacterium HGW-Bacteroidetes-16]|jgi:DNA-binding NarL/FixJ family response regulator|nr:MAG: DNA-binding response regulator [Bacteroidetes bacterium HGW-Bacteroidetes-16]